MLGKEKGKELIKKSTSETKSAHPPKDYVSIAQDSFLCNVSSDGPPVCRN